jgi:hypothetical protein
MLGYVQGTSPLLKFMQVVRWLRGALQTADLALRQPKPPADFRLGEHRPMLVAVGVDHLAEVSSLLRVS